MAEWNDWLKNLKPGDEVGVERDRWIAPSITKVERVTATQIVVDGARYRVKDGLACGADWGWSRPILRELTPEVREKIERERCVNFLRAAKYETATTETLRAAVALLKGGERG